MELERIEKEEINEKLKRSFLNYAMSVIVSRALPDVRDGLKPVQRRILYGMNQMGIYSNTQHKKSARIVGDVMGKYHPHGDYSIYEAMVRMAQPFSTRYMLVDGHGNFGNIDGDGAAAMRYTEAKMSKISMEMLRDIDKNTVDFIDNYDGSEKEPVVLPSHIPNLLVNGSVGIAVGMATMIPPHNIGEVIDGLIALIDNKDLEPSDLIEYIKGPDFPTGGIVVGLRGINNSYKTGQGTIIVKAKAIIEKTKNGKDEIIITELPYLTNKTRLIERIAELVKNKIIDGIVDIRDESNRNGIRIVLEVRRGEMAEIILNNLYKYSQLQQSYGVNMICLVGNTPKLLNLKEILEEYLKFQVEVLTKKTEFELDKALKRLHILEGYLKAHDHIEAVIKIIRETTDGTEKQRLIDEFNLSDIQSQAILDMQLKRLSGLSKEKMEEEARILEANVKEYREILANDDKKLSLIKEDLNNIKEKYSDPRKTEIQLADDLVLEDEDLIPEEEVIITITNQGYAKRIPLETYKAQGRGGVGRSTLKTKEDDDIRTIISTSTHDYIYVFTNKGRVYTIKAYQIPEYSPAAKGIPLINIIKFQDDERICTVTSISRNINKDNYLCFTTKLGLVKRTKMEEYANVQSNGKIALVLRETDELLNVFETDGTMNIIMGSNNGKSIKFAETDIRPTGRVSGGVIGIKLDENEYIVGSSYVNQEKNQVLVIAANGYGKRSKEEDYRSQLRGGIGIKAMNTTEKTGSLICLESTKEDDDLLITTDKGTIIRMHISDIPLLSRNTMGVIVVRLKDDQKIATVSIIPREENEEEKKVLS